ncbi:unnamed protein product [Ilex paraguariensis]|uniref:Uncharacterized protein n=1 Tax=Ilex paraguariensis TaxID=185542 RepID=A0ABC8SUU6_9AQUA
MICRYIGHPANDDEAEERLRAKFFSTFSRYFSVIPDFAKSMNLENNQMHTVSHRLVPSGPNPLHN